MNNTDNAARTGQDAQTYEIHNLRTGPFLARRTENGQLFIVARFDDEVELAEQQRIVAALNSHAPLVKASERMLSEYPGELGSAHTAQAQARAALALAKGGQQ